VGTTFPDLNGLPISQATYSAIPITSIMHPTLKKIVDMIAPCLIIQ
jgi:hypothetical protein